MLLCIQCMLALKRLPEKHTLIKLAAKTNKRTQILIQTGRGKRQLVKIVLFLGSVRSDIWGSLLSVRDISNVLLTMPSAHFIVQ